MKFPLLIFLCALLFLASCENPEKEDQLQQREQNLLLREQQFAAKQQDYEDLKAMRDSIKNIPDTLSAVQLPDMILGKYNGKMICTDSDCSEHVIGDLRNDIWEILPTGVRITNKSGGDKFYTGKVTDSELKLKSEETAGTAASSEITLQITDPNLSRIKGVRELKRENCVAKFSVDLEKIKN
ncbi:hypothetical protein [Kaistella palustris]|uniref:hypothetical protein n=1 Tax=Kaistella palustris TaxID=493376 RepID=UPI00041F00F1|nr:hypothetical protein [Kaistella palustris]